MSEDQDDLSQLLNSEPIAESTPEAQPQAETAPAETGDKAAAAPPAPAGESDDGPLIPRAALMDERKKRQELQTRLEELERRLSSSPPPEPAPKPDWVMEPDAAAARLIQEFEQRDFATRVTLSERFVKQQHQDYAEAEAAFMEAAKDDPVLQQKLIKHPMPAEFAYEQGKRLMVMKEVGDDPVSYRARIEAEVLARHGLSPAGATTQPPKATAPVPKSLARATSAQPRSANGQWRADPTPLEDIIG